MDYSRNSSAFNFSQLQNQPKVPAEFLWPENDITPSDGVLDVPIIDLRSFFNGDSAAKERTAASVRAACEEHGTFQVINHGVESGLIESVLEMASWFFEHPMAVKLKAQRTPEDFQGYSVGHADRFSNLLWSETLSFRFRNGSTPVVEDFFRSKLGKDFEDMGKLYQKYCEAMNHFSQELMVLMGTSLGLRDPKFYQTFFEDCSGIFRCNYYPPCMQPDRTLGTGPHCDTSALTLLLQDGVSGLEFFNKGTWKAVHPYPGAFVINVGELFMALSNGRYKSCLHRAVLNKDRVRKSLVFFSCPRADKLIVPPSDLVSGDSDEEVASRKYPDFTWSDYLNFVSSRNRAEGTSLDDFSAWFAASRKKHVDK